jgi:NUMOD3 motif
MNKYKKWYDQIIANGLAVKLPGYERHHIFPKSLGGSDNESNLIYITAREHFICHWLLTKIYPVGEEHWKMLNALRMMRAENKNQCRYNTKITSRVYAKIKEEYAKLQSERYSGENNPMYGDKFHRSQEGYKRQREAVLGEKNGAKKEESRKKISDSKLGKSRDLFSDEWKSNMSLSKQGEKNNMFGKNHSHDTIEKIREKAKLRTYSDETNEKRRQANLGLKREKKLCLHCHELVAVNGYARWHGDNCKKRKSA